MNNMMLGISLGIAFYIVGTISPIGPGLSGDTDSFIVQAKARIQFYTDMLVELAPPYVWGGFWGLLGGDCSGQMRWIFKMAGIVYPRLTALSMWNGGWPGRRYKSSLATLSQAEFPNVIFFTYKPNRPAGHVGIVRKVWKTAKGAWRVLFAEASSSAKYFKETLIKEGDYRWKHTLGLLVPDLSPGFDGGR
jgi:hypothetical protein